MPFFLGPRYTFCCFISNWILFIFIILDADRNINHSTYTSKFDE